MLAALPGAMLELVWSFLSPRVQCARGSLVCQRFRGLVKRGVLTLRTGTYGSAVGRFDNLDDADFKPAS